MEDGFPLFDPNNEAERQEQKLREYYEEFSANARKRLLAKIVNRPSSVYDVLYPQTREALMAKNVPINNDLEEGAKIIRDKLIAKIVTEETDLEKISADFRKSLLARTKIQQDRNVFLKNSDAYRQNNLSKNSTKKTDLESDSNFARVNNVSKNKPNPSFRGGVENSNSAFKDNNISKNVSKDQDLLRDSDDFRKGDIHKNVIKESDIEKDSERFRDNNLHKNVKNRPKTLDEIAKAQRESQLAKNYKKTSDIGDESETFRKDDVSKNTTRDQDLLRDSEDIRNSFRKNDIHKNVKIDTDIEADSVAFRKSNVSKNKGKTSDIEADSEVFRSDDLSANKSKISDLEVDSVRFRTDDLSANKPKTSDLETDSEIFRSDDLSANKPKTSNLEKDSEVFRSDDLSLNKPKTSDIEKDSEVFRSDDLSLNKPKTSDLENDSEVFRSDDLSLNKPKTSDIESDSEVFRSDDLSLNKPKTSDLENDSEVFRSDDLSLNKPVVSNLETDSIPFRSDDLSLNKPNFSNLEEDSEVFRSDDLSFNTPNITSLETDSIPFRDDDLSLNTPNITDLETDSVQFRFDDLSANDPIITDLIVDSTPFLYNNLSSNVPGDSDIEEDSVPFREDDLSANVFNGSDLLSDSAPFRDDDLSSNVPSESNLLVDSVPFRNNDLAANIGIDSSILADSVPFRDNAMSANVPSGTDLLSDSITYRKEAISKNDIFGLLGVSVQGAGTSAFLGISRVFTQGILVRQLLKSKNAPNESNLIEDGYHFRVNNLARNLWVPQAAQAGTSLEYGTSNTHFNLLLATREATDDTGVRAGFDETGSPTERNIAAQASFFNNKQDFTQFIYGNTPREFATNTRFDLNDKAFSTDRTSPKGGRFDTPTNSAEAAITYSEGLVTENIRLYNLERNSYNIKGLQVGGLDGFDWLSTFNEGDEFQSLIASTIGSLNVRQSISTQAGTNTTPADVIIKNEGQYIKGAGNSDILRPTAQDAPLGFAESMMGKTALGNPYEDTDFLLGKRGVRHVVNTIKNSKQPLSKNFDPQNNKAYITGADKDGSPKVSRQRFTIANPYKAGRAGKLLFSLKNYSSGDQYFFPPYIQSIQNTESANWNSVNFLGRPEAIYTYNNSSRSASISFFVLTDYSQRVDIGRDWKKDDMPNIPVDLPRHFTERDYSQNERRRAQIQKLKEKQSDDKKKQKELKEKQQELASQSNDIQQKQNEIDRNDAGGSSASGAGNIFSWANDAVNAEKAKKKNAEAAIDNEAARKKNAVESGEVEEQKKQLADEQGITNEALGEATKTANSPTNYSESNNTSANIYNLDMTKLEKNGDEIICKPEDTKKRIDSMKAGLMFQPAFFSGDKIDFVRRIEFLSKLTRPSANDSETGFSFTKPPISHIRLGDWWDHDIVVNSVSYDYADAPWTLDGGRVQPMWVLVSLDFNIIGPYGSASARPPLSTDAGGMYS